MPPPPPMRLRHGVDALVAVVAAVAQHQQAAHPPAGVLVVQGVQHGADIGAFAVRLAGAVQRKRLDFVRETVELDLDVLLAQPI